MQHFNIIFAALWDLVVISNLLLLALGACFFDYYGRRSSRIFYRQPARESHRRMLMFCSLTAMMLGILYLSSLWLAPVRITRAITPERAGVFYLEGLQSYQLDTVNIPLVSADTMYVTIGNAGAMAMTVSSVRFVWRRGNGGECVHEQCVHEPAHSLTLAYALCMLLWYKYR